MKHGTYAQKLDDGCYEFGFLVERSRCVGAYQGALAHYSEWVFLPPKRQPRGVAVDYETARRCMAAIEE